MTTTGVAYFRSNVLEFLAQDADHFRGYLVPVQLFGYKRMNLSFNLHSDGITLDWTVTDVEQRLGENQRAKCCVGQQIITADGLAGIERRLPECLP